MFPLIKENDGNPLELFQIWLNLPPEAKMVPAHFGMLWSEDIPTIAPAVGVSVDVIAGRIGEATPPSPPPDSWGSHPNGELAIWLIRLEAGATWTLPTAPPDVNRMLHCFLGDEARVAGTPVTKDIGVQVRPDVPVEIRAMGGPVEFLMLQGRPIGAPVFQMGPFVMNSPEELRQAVVDYRSTQFGGWPWGRPDPVHERREGRFALHADGKVEHRDMQPATG
jgi:redox-sensitive bicupin YhaK (pirin superfamily)